MAYKALPCPTLLRQLLRYEPETGKLFWNPRGAAFFRSSGRRQDWQMKAWNGKHAGKEAFTCINNRGYFSGLINGRAFLAHRLIWAIVHGEDPVGQLDHENRNPQDNRIGNLRIATPSQNCANRSNRTGGFSAFRGVCRDKKTGKWTTTIGRGGKGKGQRTIGRFKTEEEAARAYDAAALVVFGEFACLNFPNEVAK